MNCNSVHELMDDWIDDGLPSSDAQAFEAHLESCEACRAEVEAQRRLLARAAALSPERMPAVDLWPGIAARLDRSRQRGPRPWFIAMAASLLLAGVFFAGMLADRVLQEGSDEMAPQVAAVERIPEGSERAAARRILPRAQVELVSGSTDPETEDVMLHNLLIVNLAIRQLEQAVESEPDNPELRRLLTSLYEQENRLLRRAERLAGTGHATTKRIGI